MKFYDTPGAPNPRRVRMFLAEKAIAIPSVAIDLGKLEQKSEAYTAVNPRQRTPALELDDGKVICESMAICRYLEALHPEPNLFGRTPLEIGEIEMWTRRLELYLLSTIASAFRHLHPAMVEMEVPQVKEWGEVNRARIVDELGVLDRHLQGKDHIAAGRFTVADITALVAVDFVRPTRVPIPEDLTNLARWRAAASARPSAQA
ncbi:glutathione S-transferase family protein [Phreatobacter stygius]|uniref:Glutathione S-transferase n=1 Tax=Phreatobacter stygius TaxID=1940610 RepID=A0A4D7B8Y8_9HYPH|nr:glutathione S-transferase N-terminal domain-containing protein [Phreatobacter stygius]QCI66708.1 glutathione S-transferase [Phreatobacter stygius]